MLGLARARGLGARLENVALFAGLTTVSLLFVALRKTYLYPDDVTIPYLSGPRLWFSASLIAGTVGASLVLRVRRSQRLRLRGVAALSLSASPLVLVLALLVVVAVAYVAGVQVFIWAQGAA